MTPVLACLPFLLQALAMSLDEGLCHRDLARIERLGHRVDTAAFLACLGLALLAPPTPGALRLYAGLAIGSCLLITKDEGLHQRRCGPFEHWLHAVLFMLHPLVLVAAAWLWMGGHRTPLRLQASLTGLFLLVQAVPRRAPGRPPVDNSLYDRLGDRWYDADDDPVALLRAESRLRAGWARERLETLGGGRPLRVLDVACGAGFLANPLARAGHRVTGIDLSAPSLAVARAHDVTGRVDYRIMDARGLVFPDASFDAVTMMDFLEHVEDPGAVLAEAARVLRPGGLLLFHTFNRTALADLVVIRGVRWAVRNTPRHLHVLHLFITPEELAGLCARQGLAATGFRGVAPRVMSWPFLRLLATGRVGEDLRFRFTRSLALGYCGEARKGESQVEII